MPRLRKNAKVLITSAKVKGKTFYFIDGLGPKGPHLETRFVSRDDVGRPEATQHLVLGGLALVQCLADHAGSERAGLSR